MNTLITIHSHQKLPKLGRCTVVFSTLSSIDAPIVIRRRRRTSEVGN